MVSLVADYGSDDEPDAKPAAPKPSKSSDLFSIAKTSSGKKQITLKRTFDTTVSDDEEKPEAPKLKKSTAGCGLSALLPPAKHTAETRTPKNPNQPANRGPSEIAPSGLMMPHSLRGKVKPLTELPKPPPPPKAPVVDVAPRTDYDPQDFFGFDEAGDAPAEPAEEFRVGGRPLAAPAPRQDDDEQEEAEEEQYAPHPSELYANPAANPDVWENARQQILREQAEETLGGADRFIPASERKFLKAGLVEIHQNMLVKPEDLVMEREEDVYAQEQAALARQQKPSYVAKRKHQIHYLAHQAATNRIAIERKLAQGTLSKSQTWGKYGW